MKGMLLERKVAVVLGVLTLLVAGAQCGAVNLLVNGDFETPPYGSQVVPGWNWWGASADDLFDGVFDSTWNVPPPCNPSDPSNYGPHGGSYFLGRYYKPLGCAGYGGGRRGGLYQQVNDLIPGKTYYAQAWFATHHPHGGGAGFRIGLDPNPGTNPSPDTVWEPPISPIWGDVFAYSEATYRKLEVAATVGESGSLAVWLQYTMTENTLSEPQIVQVDDVRLADTHSMEILNIDVIGVTSNIVSVQFDTLDGQNPVSTYGYVDYGLTSGYGNTKADASNPRSNHEIQLTGLTAGATYHYRIRATAADYEDAATVDLTFVAQLSLYIKNVTATPLDGGTSCLIEWDTVKSATDPTPVPSDSRVDFGLSASYGQSVYDPELVSHHSIVINGLYPSTKYYYRVASVGPGYNAQRYPKPPVTVTFVTKPGAELFNGDFEVSVPNRTPNSDIPGWQKAYGNAQWFRSGEWSIPSQSGMLYTGSVANYGLHNCVLYQRVLATPGQEVAYSAYIWSQAYGAGRPCGGYPHRFGETSGLIGIDPTGGTDPNSPSIVWSAERQTQDWHNYLEQGPCSSTATWQKVGVAAVAQSDVITVFLKTHIWYPIAWNFVCWDNVNEETFNQVATVAEARQLPNDTPIDLVGTEPLGSPIVTYIAFPNYDPDDNNGEPYFYVQDPDRKAGIKVTMAPGAEWPSWLEVGKKVNIKGCITWGVMRNRTLSGVVFDQQLRLDKPAGERVIRAMAVTDTGQFGSIKPLGVSNANIAAGSSSDAWYTNPGAVDVAGTGTVAASGLNTVGLLVKTWGRVLRAGFDSNGNNFIVIDDGSKVAGYSEYPPEPGKTGLYVFTGPYSYFGEVGKFVEVTGISGVKTDYDFDDPSYQVTPEAMMNVRCLKPLVKETGELDIRVIEE
ncbi:MAG: fibronectin type III domain-containing protein [Armatimonadota bacterium]